VCGTWVAGVVVPVPDAVHRAHLVIERGRVERLGQIPVDFLNLAERDGVAVERATVTTLRPLFDLHIEGERAGEFLGRADQRAPGGQTAVRAPRVRDLVGKPEGLESTDDELA